MEIKVSSPSNFRHKYLVIESIIWLLIARFLIRLIPLRFWIGILGKRNVVTSVESLPPAIEVQAKQIHNAIVSATRLLPGGSRRFSCFTQALAGKIMLSRRKIPCTVYIGVAPAPRTIFANLSIWAHAWVRAGNLQITGGNGSHQYGDHIACFGSREFS